MEFDQFARKFGGRLREGDVVEVYFKKPDVDWARNKKGLLLSTRGYS